MKLSINIELDTDMKWFTERQWYTKIAIVLAVLFVILIAYEKCNNQPDHQYATAAIEEMAPVAEEAAPTEKEFHW